MTKDDVKYLKIAFRAGYEAALLLSQQSAMKKKMVTERNELESKITEDFNKFMVEQMKQVPLLGEVEA